MCETIRDPVCGDRARLAARKRTSSTGPSLPDGVSEDAARVMRQALAGMLWTKQYFGLDVEKWLEEHGADPIRPERPGTCATANGSTW